MHDLPHEPWIRCCRAGVRREGHQCAGTVETGRLVSWHILIILDLAGWSGGDDHPGNGWKMM